MEKKTIIQRLKQLCLVLVTWFAVHQICSISDGLVDDEVESNNAVVFGNTVNADGSLSPRLKARLDKALELYTSKRASLFFVSGGLGKEGHLEGSKMAEYLVSKGIPSLNIVIDNQGINTRLTALNFKKHFPKSKSALLVSQYHHIARAKLAFRQVGVKNVGGVHANYFELRDFYSCFREFFGYYSYMVKY